MKAMEKDWYQKNWTLDIQNMSWVEGYRQTSRFSNQAVTFKRNGKNT